MLQFEQLLVEIHSLSASCASPFGQKKTALLTNALVFGVLRIFGSWEGGAIGGLWQAVPVLLVGAWLLRMVLNNSG